MTYKKLTKEDYAIAASNGISRSAAYKRYEVRYWSKEDAITLPVGSKLKTVLTKEDYETAKANGISQQTAYFRRRSLKWPVEKCITEPVRDTTGWKEWEKIATDGGISYDLFAKRKERGMTPKEAATKPKGKPRGNKKSL